ncbi:hypothetical protein JTE90_009104 [Oedothorax gibbosus]|uniref:Hydroxylysine kinase n=1 Tax=Oedothorax gibbosus TaxID=931172 RepID=A0AAV6V2C9_9ARAC|nr:hypothetical protein JTE90_009104 [Oedothorax gibbosus]
MESTGSPEECMKQAQAMMAKPNVTVDLAIELVKTIYGLQVTEIKSLNSFSDKNFHIKVSADHTNPNIDQISDDGYTLKIMNTLKSNLKGHFDAIHETMIRLHGKGLRVPQPIRNLDGTTWKLETLPLQESEGEVAKTLKCGIHLLTYIPGEPIANNENNEKMLFQWGELLAKFHISLKDFDCPELMEQWTFVNAKNFRLAKGILDSMPEGSMAPEAKLLVEDVLDRFSSEYEKHISDLPQGFLHGDFNDHNILFRTTETTGSYCVDGILDFDEMHHGSYAWDLGILLGHALLVKKTIDPLEAVRHAVAGYQSVRKLSEKELLFLKIAMECRVALMCFISTAVDKDPSNSYILMIAHLQPKIDILKLLSNVDNKSLLKIYDYHTHLVMV